MRKSSEPISNSITPDAALAEVTSRDEAKQQQESQAQQTPAVQQQTVQQQAGQADLGQLRGAMVPQRAGEQQQQKLLQQQRLIIARNVTRRQAQELSSNLSKQQAVQRAAVYEPRVEPRGGGANDFARQRTLAASSSQPTTRSSEAELGQKLALAPQSPAPLMSRWPRRNCPRRLPQTACPRRHSRLLHKARSPARPRLRDSALSRRPDHGAGTAGGAARNAF
jgi:hypothetical protein